MAVYYLMKILENSHDSKLGIEESIVFFSLQSQPVRKRIIRGYTKNNDLSINVIKCWMLHNLRAISCKAEKYLALSIFVQIIDVDILRIYVVYYIQIWILI